MIFNEDLYGSPEVYGRVFPLDEEELAFWKGMTGGTGAGPLLDLGAGPSGLAAMLGAPMPVALDPCAELLAFSPMSRRVRGDALALPFASGMVGAVVSRLFGLAYAAGFAPAKRLELLASELGRVLASGGVVALEIPINVRPRRLQWIEENAEIARGLFYRFRYLDLAADHELGAALNTEITVEGADGLRWEMEAPLFVFTPEGARRWAAAAGLNDVRFYACYDLTTETSTPPDDALRAVLSGRRSDRSDRSDRSAR